MNVPTAIKRGIYSVHSSLILKRVGTILPDDARNVENSLRIWLGLT
jgi:mRNA interferase MazF